jgi:hypothetical protein
MNVVHRSANILVALVGTALLAAGLVGCAPEIRLIGTAGLYPIFQYRVTDFVNRCDPENPTEVTVRAPDGTTVSVAGQAPRGGTYTTTVDQEPNERFTLVIAHDGTTTTTHHVRCLPPGFPSWTFRRSGQPQASYYATVIGGGALVPHVPVIIDTDGVPVWWADPEPTLLLNPFPNGNLVTTFYGGAMLERRLDGTPVRLLNTQGATSDFHDVRLLPNGNYVMVTADPRPCDLSPWGEGPNTCLYHDVQELTPAGQVVWNWRPEEHIPITETAQKWRGQTDPLLGLRDPWHWNSVEWTGDGFVLSFRHLDAVYKVDYATREIAWKLGGSSRPESLQVIGDPVFDAGGSISGQHDARLSGTTLTLFDNGSIVGRPPRSVAYRLDEVAGTATMLTQVTDPIAPTSPCCGSTRLLPGGNVVTGWGGSAHITENRPDGTQVFRLNAGFVYRGIPVPDGLYTPDQLRAGMDAQFDGAARAPGVVVPPSDDADGAEHLGDLEFRLGR